MIKKICKLILCLMALCFLIFGLLGLYDLAKGQSTKPPPRPDEIRAIYLGTPNIFNERKIAELENLIATTNANGIVIDYKDSNDLPQDYLTALVTRFKKHGAYVIARIVTFQDSRFARKHPDIAIKTSSGDFWYSGRKSWKRYWLDPASELAQDHNIQVAKQAINCGFDEIQFDYIRFPTDGNMKDIRYPSYNPAKKTKSEVINDFSEKARKELKDFSPNILIGIDVFGEVLAYGEVSGIGQKLSDIEKHFDVICGMFYPTHFCCGEFGERDPSAHPYKVYYIAQKNGLQFSKNKKVIFRPWIQDFTIRSIYNCGPTVVYTKEKVLDQIRAGQNLGINGFMLWNAGNHFTISVFE